MSKNVIAVILAAAFAVTVACQQAPQQAAAPSPVARGKYLVTAMVCNDCHTPWKLGEKGPEPDMTRMLSGHPQGMTLPPAPAVQPPWGLTASLTMTAWSGPWGISYTANLTPDPETGIGAWSEENFVQAIRTGKHLGAGRDILPPMPWPMYRNLSDGDLKAMFAYLKSIPPIRNQVPDPAPPAPAGK
jgi:cytochrome c553